MCSSDLLKGVTDITLSGTITAQKNTTGGDTSENITIGGVTKTLTLTKDVSRVTGDVKFTADNFLYLSGTIGVEKKTATLKLTDDSTVAASAVQIGGTGLTGFFGLNAAPGTGSQTGLNLSGISFGYTLATPTNSNGGTDLRSWSGLKASVSTASLEGISAVTAIVSSLGVSLNRAGGTLNGTNASTAANFEASSITNTAGGQSSTLDFKEALARAIGLFEFSVSGFAAFRGRFGLETGNMDVTLPSFPGVNLPTNFLRFWGIDVDASIGINGPSWSNPDFTGFDVSGFDFNLMLSMRNPLSGLLPELGAMKWFSMKASLPEMSFLPFKEFQIPDFGLNAPSLSLNLTLDVPTLSIPTPYIDYSVSLPNVTLPGLPAMPNFPGLPDLPVLPEVPAIPGFGFNLPALELLQISNLPSINLFDFISFSGSLTIKRTEYTAKLVDGTEVPTWALVMNSTNGSLFAGVNGPANSGNATGLSVAGVNGAMAMLVPKDLADKRRWMAATGSGANVSLLGLPDVTISADSIAVELNRPLGTASDGTASTSTVNFTNNALTVLMDNGTTVSITHPGSSGALLKVAADATIGIADFFTLDGNFGIENRSRSLKLSDDSTVDVDMLTIGGKDVTGFVGVNGGTEIGRAHV